ncbi:hypothetical protein D1007_34747 [Hordeum vulgare]|nr:hypothetical protein D1007_34747 [Hordeum vulgare]
MEVAYPFDAKTGMMPGPKRAREMEILRQRFQAELVAVRGLLRKAAAVGLPSAPRVKESRPCLLAEEPPAKKMKASPPVPVPVKAPRKMTSKERKPPAEKRKASPPPVPVIKSKKPKITGSETEMLAEDLEAFVAEIPDHIVELLKKQSCATRPGEIEIDLHGLDDAAVVELQEQVDKFAREKRAPPQERHQDGPKVMAQEEEEEEEYVDICGGVSPLAIVPAPLLQLVQDEATSGSPSSSSSNDSDSEDECVDICGGVSPLAFVPAPLLPLPLVQEETNSSSPCSSSSGDSDTDDSSSSGDSDTDDSSSSDSDDSEHSGSSDPDSESEEIVHSPAPAIVSPPTFEQVDRALERQRNEATSLAREKARQEVLETERNAMPDHTLHREDVKSLGIDEYNTAKQIGLYLKVDDDDEDDWNQQRRQSFHEDLEEGEIR